MLKRGDFTFDENSLVNRPEMNWSQYARAGRRDMIARPDDLGWRVGVVEAGGWAVRGASGGVIHALVRAALFR